MLVLSRKLYESVVVTPPGCGPVKITVVDIRGDKVRLSFEADPAIAIHRQEIHDRIQAGEPKPPAKTSPPRLLIPNNANNGNNAAALANRGAMLAQPRN